MKNLILLFCFATLSISYLHAERFTIISEEILVDNTTQIKWFRKPYKRLANFKEAKRLCSISNVGGESNWRLPKVEEVVSILDYSQSRQMIDWNYFSLKKSNSKILTSQKSLLYSSLEQVWSISTFDGVLALTLPNAPLNFLCVSGKTKKLNSEVLFKDLGNGTILDKKSNLIWDKKAKLLPFKDAKKHCDQLNAGNAGNWRIPRMDELIKLLNFDNTPPKINPLFLEGLPRHSAFQIIFWSSNINPVAVKSRYYINLKTGQVFPVGFEANYYNIRCVRENEV